MFPMPRAVEPQVHDPWRFWASVVALLLTFLPLAFVEDFIGYIAQDDAVDVKLLISDAILFPLIAGLAIFARWKHHDRVWIWKLLAFGLGLSLGTDLLVVLIEWKPVTTTAWIDVPILALYWISICMLFAAIVGVILNTAAAIRVMVPAAPSWRTAAGRSARYVDPCLGNLASISSESRRPCWRWRS